MWGKTPQLQSIGELILAARRQAARALPSETHQSFPIPVREPDGLRVVFLYGIGRPTFRVGLLLLPPSHLASLRADSGEFEQIRAVSPSDFGLEHPANEFLGASSFPKDLTNEEFAARKERLLGLYDLLMPQFAVGRTSLSADLKRDAAEFLDLFSQISEAPLAPYYEAEGGEYFAWLKAVSR